MSNTRFHCQYSTSRMASAFSSLNPIENVWDALGRVAGRNYPPTNKNTLIRALTEEWDKLPQQLLDNVVQIMALHMVYEVWRHSPDRLLSLKKQCGWNQDRRCRLQTRIPCQSEIIEGVKEAHPEGLERGFRSDESQFCISGNESSVYVRRRTHEEFSPQCLKPTVKYPTKVMVWGYMFSHDVGRLHIVSGTVKAMDYIEILQNKLLPTARDLFGNQSWIFQDDNAPCHREKVVQKWLKDHTVNRLNWPGQSPDLNPIENLWFKIGYEISKKKPSNKRELIEALIFSFNHIVTKDLLLELVHSMPKRCRAVIKANG
ncbi:transposable element Tcb1 transposase [Trichonephila clavipes]|nr:transposable element Tcb1 transposase [Trichonephila clavipes]